MALLPAWLVLTVLLAACGSAGEGRPASDLQATLFNGNLSEQEGEIAVVLNFWYPSCPPCRAEMPDLEKTWQHAQGKGVRFLGLLVPQGLDTEQDARELVATLG